MTLSEHAVRRPVATTMVFIGLIVLGAYSYSRLKVDFLPDVDMPSLSVVTEYPGVGPEEMENLITRPIEQAVSTVEGVESVESTSSEGRSRVRLRFTWGTDLDTALNDVRAFVDRAKGALPEDAEDPVVFKFDLTAFPVMMLSLAGDMEATELRRVADDVLRYRLERLEGVAQVDIRGGLRREVRVQLNPDSLAAYAVGADEVVQALRRENVNVPVGQVHDGERNLLLRSMGAFENVTQIENLIIRPAGRAADGSMTAAVHLHHLGFVEEGYEEQTSLVRVNGEPGIRLSVNKQADANTVETAERVRAEIDAINRDFHGQLRVGVMFDSSEFIERSMLNVEDALLIGSVLAIAILLIFLRSIRSTIVISTAIPISVIGTFTLMYLFDMSLNLISFGGIALGIGNLVDNSIVILENIYRHRENGESARQAAIRGSSEVAAAVTASTMTTVVVFAPVLFLGGFVAVFFQQMAIVVTITQIVSLFVALTLVPVLAAQATRGRFGGERGPVGRMLGALDSGYKAVLARVLRHWAIALAIFVAMLIGGGYLFQKVGREFMPADDQGEVRINIDMPMGTRVEVTEEAALQVEAIVRAVPEVREVLTVAGSPGPWSSSGEETASLNLTLRPLSERTRSSEAIAESIREQVSGLIPGAEIRVRASQPWIFRALFGGSEERLNVTIRGYDLEDAAEVARQVQAAMQSIEGVADARIDRRDGAGERRVHVDRDLASSLGVTAASVGRTLEIYVRGVLAGSVRRAGEELPIRVQLEAEDREHLASVLRAPIVLPGGGHVPVSAVAITELAQMPIDIERENQERVVEVVGGLSGERDMGSVTAELREALARIPMPEGFLATVAGESEEQEQSFGALMMGLLLSIMLVYMIMAAQFESFVNPFVIMFAIPFALVGAVGTLYFTGTTLNVNSGMGMIVLVGIVVNNAIVMIDYFGVLIKDYNMPWRRAVIEGARRRLRPILMTTLTTVLALIPLAVESGEGGQTQAPLARALAGGLAYGTLVTLFLIPIIYSGVSGLRELVTRRRRADAAEAVESKTRPTAPAA